MSSKALPLQILLKVSDELNSAIDAAFSKHLKKTGEYCTRSEFIRRMLDAQCEVEMGKK